jgi:hypothetical protein
MEREVAILLIAVAAVGMISLLAIVRRERVEARAAAAESPFAASTEGEKRCPKCGMGNLWTDATCITCGARLPG